MVDWVLWSIGLSQKALEEFAVFVEVLDGVSVVGAWGIHALVKVVRLALLGLLARAISRGNEHRVVQSVPILFVLFAPLCGGALVLILVLGLALVLASTKDRSDRILTGGVVHGDVEQVAHGSGLQTAKPVDQGLTGCPKKECANDVRVDDIRKGVALF